MVITHGNILANLEPLERADRQVPEVRAHLSSTAFSQSVAAQPRLRAVPGNLPAATAGRNCALPGHAESERGDAHDQDGARVGGGGCSPVDGVAERQDRARHGGGGQDRVVPSADWKPPRTRSSSGAGGASARIHNQFGWKFWAFISGGAALDAETEEFWRRLSFVVIQGYGLTETTSLISLNHPFHTGKRSIGKVLEGREMKLDENGEILVRGANVAAGYWQGNEMKPVLGEDGWFRTGDLGALDADGNLYFKGRKKNVIVTREGMNIYPDDLEAVLRQQPEVRDCVVVGLEQGGNAEPVAALLLRDAAADAAAIVARANQHLAEFQQMRRWLVWPDQDFPRTPTQKPKLSVIQQAVQQQFSSAARCGSGTRRIGGTHQPDHRTQHRRARARRQAGRRPEPEFDGPRGADERAGRPLPGGLERSELRAGQHRRRAGANAARAAARAAKRVSLSALGAALAGYVDSQLLLLPAVAAGDADHGASRELWAAKISKVSTGRS